MKRMLFVVLLCAFLLAGGCLWDGNTPTGPAVQELIDDPQSSPNVGMGQAPSEQQFSVRLIDKTTIKVSVPVLPDQQYRLEESPEARPVWDIFLVMSFSPAYYSWGQLSTYRFFVEEDEEELEFVFSAPQYAVFHISAKLSESSIRTFAPASSGWLKTVPGPFADGPHRYCLSRNEKRVASCN